MDVIGLGSSPRGPKLLASLKAATDPVPASLVVHHKQLVLLLVKLKHKITVNRRKRAEFPSLTSKSFSENLASVVKSFG